MKTFIISYLYAGIKRFKCVTSSRLDYYTKLEWFGVITCLDIIEL